MSNSTASNSGVRSPRSPKNSQTARLTEKLLRQTMRRLMHPRVPVAVQRFATDALRFHPRPGNVTTQAFAAPGLVGEKHTPDHLSDTQHAVLYFHGGGYIMGSPASHRNLGARIAAQARQTVYMASYRLAPEHPYPAALEDAERAYLTLLGMGYQPAHITVGGDSAGGNLSLALVQQLRDSGVALPGRLVLISPWTDATFEQAPNPNDDALLPRPWVLHIRPGFVTESQLDDPKVSPVLADFKGFPPTLVQSSSVELLSNDAARLVHAMQQAGVEVQWQEDAGLWHDYQLTAGVVPEATAAVQRIGEYIRQGLGQA